jgi:hypothetical protein
MPELMHPGFRAFRSVAIDGIASRISTAPSERTSIHIGLRAQLGPGKRKANLNSQGRCMLRHAWIIRMVPQAYLITKPVCAITGCPLQRSPHAILWGLLQSRT